MFMQQVVEHAASNFYNSLHNNPEECSPQLCHCRSLKSHPPQSKQTLLWVKLKFRLFISSRYVGQRRD